jgi:hypothetical protein
LQRFQETTLPIFAILLTTLEVAAIRRGSVLLQEVKRIGEPSDFWMSCNWLTCNLAVAWSIIL